MRENSTETSTRIKSPAVWAAIVFVAGLLARLLIVLLYQPVSFSDTPSYRRLADAVQGGFASYDGTRTPGYPVFLALTGNDRSAWLAQLVLGLATTMLLFYIGWKLTGRPWFGGLIGLTHTLNLQQLLFESNLLTESLTTFLLVSSLAGALTWLVDPSRRSVWMAFFIGLVTTLTLLVRPLFIFLPFYILIFILSSARKISRPADQAMNEAFEDKPGEMAERWRPWSRSIAFLLPVVLLLGGWIAFIHTRFGDWSLTTMTGYHLIQHTGNFFEYAPDEYAALRDTYLRYREAQIAKYGTQTNAIWEAIREMSQVSGYNFYDLSGVLTRISIQLILKHPFLFMRSAVEGWWMFWRTAVYWSAEAMRFAGLAGMISLGIQFQRVVLFLTNLIFIVTSFYFRITEGLLASRQKTARQLLSFVSPLQHAYFWFLADIIWITSIVQTLLDHGDNPRFLVPLQSVLVVWVAAFIYIKLQPPRAGLTASPQPR